MIHKEKWKWGIMTVETSNLSKKNPKFISSKRYKISYSKCIDHFSIYHVHNKSVLLNKKSLKQC